MPLLFTCSGCGAEIITYMRPAEATRCRRCEAALVVPETAQPTDRRPEQPAHVLTSEARHDLSRREPDWQPPIRRRFFGLPFVVGLLSGWLTSVVVVVGLVVWAYHWAMSQAPQQLAKRLTPPTLPSAASVSYDWALEDLMGQPIDVARFRGRVLLVNLWATWCAPCIAEMPSMATLRERLAERDADVEFLFVSSEGLPAIKAFAADHADLPFPFVRLAGPPPPELETLSIPTTFVVDRDGRIAWRHVGAADWADERVVDWLADLAGA